MTYRAKPVSQRDGSALANSNCRMASGATGIDYDTFGETTSTGAEMRKRSGDKAGGTTSSDIAVAWKTYGQVVTIRDGKTFDDALKDLRVGRLVHLDVWHATTKGPCLSGSGRYGHTMAVAPEQNEGGKWLVADPWCSPGKWTWWSEALLRAGAEDWGRRVRQATKGVDVAALWPNVPDLEAAARDLMGRYGPDHPMEGPDDVEPADTAGPKGIMYTCTDAHTGGSEMAIRAPQSLMSDYVLAVKKGQGFYRDADLTDKLGEFSSARQQPYVGTVIDGVARAIIVVTSKPYSDGVDRPTVVYVKEDAADPEDVGSPWRQWLDTDPHAPDKA